LNRDAAQRLEAWLSRALGEPVHVESTEKPGDGAAREARAIVVTTSGGEQPRRYLRIAGGEAPPAREDDRARYEEFALLCAAHDAGVHVPRPLVLCEDPGVLGASFFVTDDISARGGWLQHPGLAAQPGRELAKLHRITPPHPRLEFLDPAPDDLPAARIDRFRTRLDAIGDPQPVLEWTMRQLERGAPEGAGTVLCHGAPRPGSRLVDDRGALAILDRERCRWGDPYEDIGEFCAECRRYFAGNPEGDGPSRTGFLDGYRDISGLDIDEDLVRYWEVMATLGRAVAALEHGHRFVAGGERSVELALTGRRVAEMEIDLLVETDRIAMERTHA